MRESICRNRIKIWIKKQQDANTVKLGYNELGCLPTLDYDEHILKPNWSFSTQVNPVVTNPGCSEQKWLAQAVCFHQVWLYWNLYRESIIVRCKIYQLLVSCNFKIALSLSFYTKKKFYCPLYELKTYTNFLFIKIEYAI